MKVKSDSEVAQSCQTLRDPMDCSLPGSSVHGIFQARVLEWGAIAFTESKYMWVQNIDVTNRPPKRQANLLSHHLYIKAYLNIHLSEMSSIKKKQ